MACGDEHAWRHQKSEPRAAPVSYFDEQNDLAYELVQNSQLHKFTFSKIVEK